MKGDDMRQVREENWKAVNSMSAQEITKYQQMLMSEMPAGFLAKIMKNRGNIKAPASKMQDEQTEKKESEQKK